MALLHHYRCGSAYIPALPFSTKSLREPLVQRLNVPTFKGEEISPLAALGRDDRGALGRDDSPVISSEVEKSPDRMALGRDDKVAPASKYNTMNDRNRLILQLWFRKKYNPFQNEKKYYKGLLLP